MKASFIKVFGFFLIGMLSFQLSSRGAFSGSIRSDIKSGSFYPSSRLKLEQAIDNYTYRAGQSKVKIPLDKSIKALIMPHAGYIYSGFTAAHVSKVLSGDSIGKVILIGPDHYVGFTNGAISDVEAYKTPIGVVKLHEDASKLRLESSLFNPVLGSDNNEHSLEVILPFLQIYLKEFEIIPIVLGPCDTSLVASVVEKYIDNNTLIVVSSDLSHYLQYDEAVLKDKETINMILNMETERLKLNKNRACGKIPIIILLDIAKRHGWSPVLLHYSNSGDTAGDRSRVVGYCAIAFY